MKKYIMLVAACMAVAVSCKPDDKQPEKKATLAASPLTLQFAAASPSSQTVTVTAEETDWSHTLSENSEWVTVNREGEALTVKAADNESADPRNASIVITASAAGIKPVTISIKQAAAKVEPEKPSISVSPDKLVFEAENASGQDVAVTVTGGITWKASPSGAEEWIHITPVEGKFTVTVDDNPETLPRGAYINVSPSDKTIAAVQVRITQEAVVLPAFIEAVLPGGATPEEGITLPFTALASANFAVKVSPEDAQWTAKVEGENSGWLTVTPVVAPTQHRLFYSYKVNDSDSPRTAYIVLVHPDESVEPVKIKVTQNQKADTESTIFEDVDTDAMTQIRVEVQANDQFQDWPYSRWTLTLYSEGVTYESLWAQWKGSGERVRIILTGNPQQREDAVLEAMTYEIVPYDQFNVLPLTERKPGWACAGQGNGESFYPSGTWYQIMENGSVTKCANAVSGSVTITKEGEDYTIAWDLVSDAGCKITGSYTGPANTL